MEQCKANATEVALTFDAAAYQEKYGALDDMQVVITLSTSSSNSYQQDIGEPYKEALDQFTAGIFLQCYVMYDGQQSTTRTINLESDCGRPHKIPKRACEANSTILYLELGEYEGSNRTVLEIEQNGASKLLTYPSDQTEFWISGDVKKVVYYAVLNDGQESLKSTQEKHVCLPPPRMLTTCTHM